MTDASLPAGAARRLDTASVAAKAHLPPKPKKVK
jgi:hypothetical protein